MEPSYLEQIRNQVLAELQSCQERTLQTFVPTIIAVGLIAIADRENFALVTLVSSFAVLFGSSMYVASLAYKIFRNGSYLQALNEIDDGCDTHSWSAALQKFNAVVKPPGVIGYETTTIAIIYLVFSGAFVLMFFEINRSLALLLGFVLALIALRIYIIPKSVVPHVERWRQVFAELESVREDET